MYRKGAPPRGYIANLEGDDYWLEKDGLQVLADFMDGKNNSDLGSVFQNYYRESGDKYFPLLLTSRNVCDFQDMFITQDFGPIFVMDRCFGVYRSDSEEGASNYNSITTQECRCSERIRLARTVENFIR